MQREREKEIQIYRGVLRKRVQAKGEKLEIIAVVVFLYKRDKMT